MDIDTVNLHNELNHLKSVTDLCDGFHQHIAQADEFPQLSGEVTVEDGVIHVRTLNHDITATPRPVKVASSYAIEYTFCVLFDAMFVPLLQFYLQDGGRLTQGANAGSTGVCDFDNKYIKKYILASVTNTLLNSLIFEPHGIDTAG